MIKKFWEFVSGSDTKVTVLLILSLFLLVGLGCRGIGKSETKLIPPAYLGEWEGQDGSEISLRADGTGDYRAGGTKIEGGTAEVDENAKTISVTFFGMGKTLKIDEPPTGDRMKLEGVAFRRKGGFSTSSIERTDQSNAQESNGGLPFPADKESGSDKSGSGGDEEPSKSEVESLVKDSIGNFAEAVEQGDFTDFHSRTSERFQAQFSPAQLEKTFEAFIQKKEQVLPSLNSVGGASADFTKGPEMRGGASDKILTADGTFATRPYPVQFETEYEMENGEWKLRKIRVKM